MYTPRTYAEFSTTDECDELLWGDKNQTKHTEAFFTLWAKACDNLIYDTIQSKEETVKDKDGNKTTTTVLVARRVVVNTRLDKYKADIKTDASATLKQKLRDRPVKFPEREPNRKKFLECLARLDPNAQNPAGDATAVTAFITNIYANRGVEGAEKQQKFLYLHQADQGGGGKGLFQNAFTSYAKSIGLTVGIIDPADTRFVPDVAAYADVLIGKEVGKLPKECYSVLNPIVDNETFQSEKKHCDKRTVRSRATLLLASNNEFPDRNRRRVAEMTFAANKIEELKPEELKYYEAYDPKMTDDGIVHFNNAAKGVKDAWDGLFKYCVFDAIYKDPAVNDDKKLFPHSYLRGLQIMQQFMDADAGDGKYAEKYGTPLGCRVKTEFRDLDHCLYCARKAEFAGFSNSSDINVNRACLAQLVNEAQRRGFWGESKRGIRADRLKFSAYDFAGCTVDAPDIEDGYSLSAIHARWNKLIAAYTTKVPEDPTRGGKRNDGHPEDPGRCEGHPQECEVDTLQKQCAAANRDGAGVSDRDHDHDMGLHGGPEATHDRADEAQAVGGGLDATIDQLLDSLNGSGVDSPTSPTCTSDDKPGSVTVVGGSTVSSSTSRERVVTETHDHGDTECKPGDFILPDNIIGIEVTDPSDGSKKILDGISVTWLPDETLACFKKFTKGPDCMPLDKWKADPGKKTPEFLVNCVNKRDRIGRHAKDVYPTYIVFEADHIDGEAQLRNIDWDKARGHIASITDSMRASKHILVPLGEDGERITDNKVMALVCQEVGREFFHDASVLDPATWTINRLTRCPGGIRTTVGRCPAEADLRQPRRHSAGQHRRHRREGHRQAGRREDKGRLTHGHGRIRNRQADRCADDPPQPRMDTPGQVR